MKKEELDKLYKDQMDVESLRILLAEARAELASRAGMTNESNYVALERVTRDFLTARLDMEKITLDRLRREDEESCKCLEDILNAWQAMRVAVMSKGETDQAVGQVLDCFTSAKALLDERRTTAEPFTPPDAIFVKDRAMKDALRCIYPDMYAELLGQQK